MNGKVKKVLVIFKVVFIEILSEGALDFLFLSKSAFRKNVWKT